MGSLIVQVLNDISSRESMLNIESSLLTRRMLLVPGIVLVQYVCQRNIENGAQNTPSIRYWKGWMCLEMYSIDKLFNIAQIFEL